MNATLPVTVTWVCPFCSRTTHLEGEPADIDCCIEALRTRHRHQPPRPRRGEPRGNRA